MFHLEIKSRHSLVTSWFAGPLPCRASSSIWRDGAGGQHRAERDRLLLMAGKLISLHDADRLPRAGSAVSGCSASAFPAVMHAKLLLVVGLVGYEPLLPASCCADFNNGSNTRSHVWFRWFNEICCRVLVGRLTLVVLKPFECSAFSGFPRGKMVATVVRAVVRSPLSAEDLTRRRWRAAIRSAIPGVSALR